MVQRGLGDGRAQHGCAVWRHGGVDDRRDKVITLITPDDGFVEESDGDF